MRNLVDRPWRLAAAALCLAVWSGCAPPGQPPGGGAPMSLTEAMGPGKTDGYLRALEPVVITWPRDHGPHPGFQTEWWYVVGTLDADEGAFGYQITFFRSALRPPAAASEGAAASEWSSDDVFMAHFAITDAAEDRFRAFERFARGGGVGLAGAGTDPLAVWLDDWRLEGDAGAFPRRLVAGEGDVSLELTFEPGKPPVLQGDAGLSQKGAEPGNASHYYSQTRMPTSGSLTIEERTFAVRGTSWMDREWSTSALEPGQVGWDWFALQLSDGRDLMAYRMRRAGGRTDPHSSGTIVEADGTYRALEATEYGIEVTDWWTSDETGVRYPAGWRVTSAAAGTDLTVAPLIDAQEHTGSVLYWEGAVEVRGTSDGRPVTGRGYVELTGYEAPDAD